MTQLPDWQWNEFGQVGTDYADPHEVEIYENRMLEFRDIHAENCTAIAKLDVPSDGVVLEIGCGTGLFSRAIAPLCKTVTACDISEVMLQYAAMKSEAAGIRNISFKRNGFLTLDEPDNTYDAVMTSLALHHLPDFWKSAAIGKVYRAMKPGGRLYIYDVIFDDDGVSNEFGYLADTVVPNVPDAARFNFMRHIRQEYSTFDWIMRGILERNGFEILENAVADASRTIHTLLCRK